MVLERGEGGLGVKEGGGTEEDPERFHIGGRIGSLEEKDNNTI